MSTKLYNSLSILLFVFVLLGGSSLNAQVVSFSEISGDSGNNDGTNDGIVELTGAPGTDLSCMVISNSEWVVVLPPGTTMPASGVFLIACSEGQNTGSNPNPVPGSGISCASCDFPGLPIDFDVCDPVNAAYIDWSSTGFTIDNAADDDGDQLVLFTASGNVLDAVSFGCGSRFLMGDNTTVAPAMCGYGSSSGRGGGDLQYQLGTPTWNGFGNPALLPVALQPGGTCAGATYFMPAINTGIYTDLTSVSNTGGKPINNSVLQGCNSSFIKLNGTWIKTDHPNPGLPNNSPADNLTITGDTIQCSPGSPVSFTLEVYNWQQVEPLAIIPSGPGAGNVGSFISFDGGVTRQNWTSVTFNPVTGVTTLSYTAPAPVGEQTISLVWDDWHRSNIASTPAGSGSGTAVVNNTTPSDCYVVRNVKLRSVDAMTASKTNISCPADFMAGTVNIGSLITGGYDIEYRLYDNGVLQETNATGIFGIPNTFTGPITVVVTDGSGCTPDITININNNCAAPPLCPDPNGEEINGGAGPITVCKDENFTLSVDAATSVNLPAGGTIDWYFNKTTPFNPYTGEGTYMGKSDITGTVPAPAKDCSTFAPGDIAIVAFQSVNPDIFAFVALVDIAGGAQINFTDNGWRNTNVFRTGEGVITWTAPAGGITAGTVVTITPSTNSATSGTVTNLIGSLDFAAAGDQIIAFCGTFNTGTGAISGIVLTAVHFNAASWEANATSSNTSALPLGLTNNVNAVAVGNFDSGRFTCAGGTVTGSTSAVSTMINTSANWTLSNSILSPQVSTCDYDITGLTMPGMVTDFTTSFGEDMCGMLLYVKGIVRPFPGAPCSEDDASTMTFQVTVNCPSAILSGGGTACAPGTVPLTIDFSGYTGSPTFTINYTIDGVAQPPIMTTSDPYVLNAGTTGEYQITGVTATGNCIFTVSGAALVNINPAPDVSLSGSLDVCPGSIAEVPVSINSGTLPLTINYTLNGIPQAPVEIFSNFLNVPIPEGTPAGPYVLVISSVVDDNQCSGTSSGMFTINVLAIPADSDPISDKNFCYDNSGTLNIFVELPSLPAGLTSDWYDAEFGGTLVQGNSKDLNINISPTGPFPQTITYWREIRNTATGCVSANRVPVNVIINLDPDLVQPADQSNICPATSVDLANLTITDNNGTTGTFSYYATLADALAEINPISSVITVSGTYYIRKTTAQECFDVVPVVVNISACVSCPVITAVTTSGSLCSASEIDLIASGLSGMGMGANGEMDFGIEFKSFTMIPGDPYVGGTSLGTVPYSGLTMGGTEAVLSNVTLSAGTYYIYAILSPASAIAGCAPAASVQVTINQSPALSETHVSPSCPGDNDGSIDITVTGNSPFSFNWTTMGGSGLTPGAEDQTGLTAGNYFVTVTDNNSCTASLNITLADGVDNTPPVITCPADVTIQCDDNTAPTSTGTATATDNCSVPVVTYSDVANLNGCGGYTGTITRTWLATDGSNNTATCTQVISIIDTESPVFNPPLPADLTVQCADLVPSASSVTASDNCDLSVSVTMVETITPGSCPNQMTIVRVYTATDDCGNTITHQQTITVNDNTAPVFDAPLPADITVSCDNVPTAPTLTATDNCAGAGPAVPVVWINEIHYDNNGADVNEFVEVAGTAGIDLADYSLILYNGSNGQSYNTLVLLGVIPNESNGFGAIAFTYLPNGIQNGAPDGVALVHNPSGTVIYFLSYEGSFTATNGPANGQTSVDIGVFETGTEAPGMSLRLSGTGSDYPDFTWQSPAAATPGSLNTGQTMVPAGMPASITYTYNETNTPGGCPNERTLTRTWTATDACNNTATHIQVVTVVDDAAPVFDQTLPADLTVECTDMVPTAPVLTATDNCDADVTVSYSEMIVQGNCPNEATITRTWTATDDCGNSTLHTQVITVDDNTAPTFVQALPADLTVSCDVIPVAPELTATDNCTTTAGPGTPVVWINEIHYDNTGADVNEFIEIAGTAGVDLADYSLVLYNGSNGQSYDTKLLSGLLPNESNGFGAIAFTYPSNGIQNGAPDGVALVYNPSGTVVYFLSYEGVFTATNGPAMGQTSVDIGVSETGSEPAGLSLRLTGMGSDYPDFTWQAPATQSPDLLNQGQTMVSGSGGAPGAADVSFVETITPGSCPNEGVITRTWTATDECGNATTHTQNITVVDDTPPSFVEPLPDDVTVECDNIPAVPVVISTDDCSPLTGGAMPIIWINELHYDNVGVDVNEFIEIAGTAGVDLSAYSLVLYNGANGQFYSSTPLAGIIPNQSAGYGAVAFTYPVDGIQNGSPDGIALVQGSTVIQFLSYEGTFTATNGPASGMMSTDIGVQEASSTPVGMSLQLTGTGNEYADFNWVGPVAQSPGLINVNQTISPVIITPVLTSSFTAGGCPQEGTLTRTWTATDACGNTATYIQIITVIDTTAPVFAGTLPQDITIECDQPVPGAPNLTASDNCDTNVPVIFSSVTTPGSCPQESEITRTYTATDDCGNSVTHSYTITIIDSKAPVFNGTLPQDITIECDQATPPVPVITATDNCAPVINVVFTTVTEQGKCPQEQVITRTFTATDPCGNSAVHSYKITKADTKAPVISNIGPDLVINCDQPVPQADVASVTDNCDPDPVVTFTETSTQSPHSSLCAHYTYTIKRTWTATDACGNKSAKTQTIQVQDVTPPFITMIPPADITLECDESGDHACPMPLDDCDENATIVLSIKIEPLPGYCPNSYIVHRSWLAGDRCGNTVTLTQNVVVIDSEAPDIKCPSNIVKTSGVPTVVTWPDAKAGDYCDGITPTVQIAGPPSGSIFQPNTKTLIVYQATDECGNASTCSFSVIITETGTGPDGNKLSGEIVTADGKQINTVEMTMSDGMNQFITADGQYEFGDIPDGTDVTVTPKKDINPLNGVNTLDLVHITNHILGKKALDSPYKKLAADANNDGKITTGDLLQIRKLILHVIDKFENKDSWTFLVKDPAFVDPYQPIPGVISDNMSIKNIQKDEVVNFIGIKTADVTWDAKTSSVNGAAEVRTAEVARVLTDNKAFMAGESITVPFAIENNGNLKAVQFSMKFDTSALEFMKVDALSELVHDDYFGLRYTGDGYLTVSFDKLPAGTQDAMFAISFRTKSDGELKDNIQINSHLTPAQAYTVDEEAIQVAIGFRENAQTEDPEQIMLFQNEPNPYQNASVIRFYLPQDSYASLSIMNAQGQEVVRFAQDFTKGMNTVQLDSGTLPAPGMYHYSLKCADTVLTKKLIFIR